ncbi:MAG: 2-C-methyl-D-erythritol 4-phosphate cytidylyltransferase [Candidatus Limnocylindrales bacterium]|nr:2-C-methyl-D-erythritol 4-phosphate cytidylyltransferase [Candidatus Limnocylindrales bacterium]
MTRPTIRADAIVVAAGGSTRMDGTDKLVAELAGRPLLAWTLEAISAAPEVERILVVTSAGRVVEVAESPWLPGSVVDVVAGGSRRQESVHAGFVALDRFEPDERGVVLIHDGARPLVTRALVGKVAVETARHGAAIPILPIAETLKRIDGDVVGETVERTGLGAAQTPQGVRRDLLRAAYQRFPADGPETWTDEAALLEAIGVPVRVVPGDPVNLKVTVPDDLARAEAILTGARSVRTGIGHDSHPFGPDAPLMLGGVEIPGAPRLHGHSDGDVVLHAIADALLGASALGDLGRLFPADARTPRGIASAELLRSVRIRLAEAGWRPASVDVTVIAARPRLGDHLEAMRAAVGELLGLDVSAVNVKASSGNLDGADGAGRSISAVAIAMVARIR